MFSLCPGPSRALDFENKNLKFQKLAMILRNSEILCCCFQAARPAHPKSYYSAVFREMGLCDFFDHKIHGNDEKTSESQNCYEKVGRFGVNQNTFSFWRRSDKSLALVLKWLELSITPLKLCFHRFFGDLANYQNFKIWNCNRCQNFDLSKLRASHFERSTDFAK